MLKALRKLARLCGSAVRFMLGRPHIYLDPADGGASRWCANCERFDIERRPFTIPQCPGKPPEWP